MTDDKRPKRHSPVRLDADDQIRGDRRDSERVQINREFACIDEYIAEYVTSISASGVFIRSKNPLPVGTKVNLEFSIILDDIETVEGEGEIVRVDTSEERKGMGVAFTRLSAESKQLIDQILDRHLSDDRSRDTF